MTTTAISLPAVKLLFLVFGFPYLSVLKPLDAREAGFLVHKHPFPALDFSLATSLWCCCFPRRVWKMRDCFKIFRSIHSTAGKLGRGTEKKRQSWHFALKADKRNLPKTYSCRDQSFSQSRDKTTVVSKEMGFFIPWSLFHQSLFIKPQCSHVIPYTLRYHWAYCHKLHRALEHIQGDLLEITQQVCKGGSSTIQAPSCPFSPSLMARIIAAQRHC